MNPCIFRSAKNSRGTAENAEIKTWLGEEAAPLEREQFKGFFPVVSAPTKKKAIALDNALHQHEFTAVFAPMKTFTAVVERRPETNLFVGFIPAFPGAHSQGTTRDELNENLREVVAMLLEDRESKLEV